MRKLKRSKPGTAISGEVKLKGRRNGLFVHKGAESVWLVQQPLNDSCGRS